MALTEQQFLRVVRKQHARSHLLEEFAQKAHDNLDSLVAQTEAHMLAGLNFQQAVMQTFDDWHLELLDVVERGKLKDKD